MSEKDNQKQASDENALVTMVEKLTQALIDLSHQAGLKTSVWTVNDVERAKALRDFGIHGLITDFPKLMLEQL